MASRRDRQVRAAAFALDLAILLFAVGLAIVAGAILDGVFGPLLPADAFGLPR